MGDVNIPEEVRFDVECMSELWHHTVELKHRVLLTPLESGIVQVECQDEDCQLDSDGFGPWWDNWNYYASFRSQLAQEVRGG